VDGCEKEFNYTYAFDELNQLTDNSSSSGSTPGTGKGKTGTGATPSLGLGGITDQIDDALNKEETPVNKWAEKIRKAFLNHDWEGLGKTIADMLNIGIRKIYDVISWSNVGPKIAAFCDAFTRSFNSLVENIHWDRLGRTVGAGINTLVNTFELLIGPGGIDFVNIGNKLATGLRGMIDEVNWPNLGQVLGSGFMISWNILDGFVQKMSKENNAGLTGWEQLGTAISDAMNGAFGRISFSKIATTIATGLNGAFQALATWTQNFNWGELVNNISNGINTFIGKFKWKENGTSLNTFITNLLNALVDIAEKTDWESFGRGIGLFLSQIDWGSHLKDLATVLLDVLSGIFSGLGETTAGKFVLAFAGVGLVSKADTLVSSILVAMGKLPTGTSATATLLGTALSKIATAFSTSTLGTTVGVYALEAVDKLKAIPNTITTQIAPKILEVITTKLWPAATAFAGSIGTWITGTFAPAMATAFSTLGSVLFSPIGLAVIGAVVGGFLLWQNWDTVTEFAGKAKEAIENAFSTAGTWLYTHGSNLINGLYNGAKNVISTVGTWLKTNISDPIINGVKNLFGIHSPSTVFAEIGGYLISGLNQGISDRIPVGVGWQYSEHGKVSGISGNVDMDVFYKDYRGTAQKGETKMVKISNCGHDENGRYAGGKAGDQTGTEYQIMNWYSRPWLCVLRFNDAKIASMIADMATKAAQNNLIGYDQGTAGNSNDRYTFWQHLKASNYDPAQITVACESDCSASTAAIVKGAGYRLNNAKLKAVSIYLTTRNMRAAMKAAGAKVLTDSKYLTSGDYLKAGDILLNDNHHVAIAVTTGAKVSTPSTTLTGTFQTRLPILRKGSSGTAVAMLQAMLGVEADGQFGDDTYNSLKVFQKNVGVTANGTCGIDTWKRVIEHMKANTK
jgi:peptidoglycan hydrolase-like protein with peptidoglycan-binding domain